MPESYYDRMRSGTLAALSARGYADGGPAESDDDLANDIGEAIEAGPTNSPGPVHAGNSDKITLDPATIHNELKRGPMIHIGAGDAGQIKRDWTPPAPPRPAPRAGLKDLGLGAQKSIVNLAHTFLSPGEATTSARLAGGHTITDELLGGVGINQQQLNDELAARSSTGSRILQGIGSAPGEGVRYGLGTAAGTALTGNPITGAAVGSGLVDALNAAGEGQTKEEAARQGVTSGIVAGGLGALGEEFVNPAARELAEKLPTHEELNAARDAANARLRASGVYSGANPNLGFNTDTLRDLAISTGAQLGGGVYTVGEQAAARAALVKKWITEQRNQELTPQEQDLFHQARQSSPELNDVGDLMLPLEARQIIKSPQQVEAVSRMLRAIPDSYKLASAAKMGVSKLGWYRGSSQALMDVFGDDAPRFAQLLAAMSPQTSVESNLHNALSMWKNWTAAGRPTDEALIYRIMGKSVQGGGTEKSALGAWKNNTYRALSAPNPQDVVLSGPKVDSFYHNLRDDVFRVTNDAWMANALGIAQDAFQGQGANVLAGNPGMTPMYAGASARLRDASLKAGMLPSQGQETVWSTAMQLYELARKNSMHPREVLERGMLTPEIIRGAPDFSTLLKDPKYARILESAGYGQQLQNMKPFQFPETSVPMSSAEQEQFGHIADILGETARMRGDVSAATKFAMPGTPPRGWGSIQAEAVPTNTGHFPAVQKLPWETRKNYTSGAFSGLQNLRDQGSLFGSSQMAPTENVIGSYIPEGKTKAVTNPARSQGFTAPLVPDAEGKLQVDPQYMANVRGPAAAQNVMLAQQSTGIPVMVANPEGNHLSIRLSDKPPLQPNEMAKLQQKYGNFAFAQTGSRLHALNLGDVPITEEMAKDMTAMARGKSFTRADNLGDYLDFANQWAKQPGSGAVTEKMMDYINAMTPEARGALDQELRDSAAKVLGFYQQKIRTQGWKPRKDLMNLLGTAHAEGLPGIEEGLKKGAFFPALAGGLLAPHLLEHERGSGQSGQAPTD